MQIPPYQRGQGDVGEQEVGAIHELPLQYVETQNFASLLRHIFFPYFSKKCNFFDFLLSYSYINMQN